MFSKSVCVALLSISLSAFMIEATPVLKNPEDCGLPQTVFKTVTVTASASSNTGKASTGSNNSGSTGKSSTGSSSNAGAGKGNTSSGNTSSSSGNTGKGSSSSGNTGAGKGNTGSSKNTTTAKSSTSTGKASTGSGNSGAGKGNTGSSKSTTTAKGSTSTTTAKGTTATEVSTGANNAGAGGAAGNNGGAAAGGDAQTSLTLDPKVIATGFNNNGQNVPTAGQVASLTSTNNFINFCLTVPNLPITNGKQITTGSCNPAPIGIIPNVDTMPSSKFTFPTNFGAVKANTAFTATMAVNNLVTGNFVNAQENYFAAPQQLDPSGKIIGHTHFVIEQLTSLTQTTPTDPGTFAFFKGINGAAVGGIVNTPVADGLPEGAYRICSINSAANHQPVIAPVAQHGSLDDCSYFESTADGNPTNNIIAGGANNAGAGAAAGNATASAGASGAASVAASSAAASASVPAKGGAAASASVSAIASASASVKGGNGAQASASASAAVGGKGAQTASSAAAVETAKGGKGAQAASSAAAPVATAKGGKGAQAASSAAAPVATAKGGKGAAASSSAAPVATAKGGKASSAAAPAQTAKGGKNPGDTVVGGFNPTANQKDAKKQ